LKLTGATVKRADDRLASETEADFSSPVPLLAAIRRIRWRAVIRARNLASHAASPRSLPGLSR
jgi:hypothetical protein